MTRGEGGGVCDIQPEFSRGGLEPVYPLVNRTSCCMIINSGGLQIGGFCVPVELAQGGSAINGADLSSLSSI